MKTMSARRTIYLDGVIAGLIGAAIIAIWFLFLDTVTRLPFYTPTVMGEGLFLEGQGVSSREELQVSLKLILLYTGVHGLVFIALGVIAAYFLLSTKRPLNIGLSSLMLFLILEFGFIGTWFIVAKPILDQLAWITVLLGNCLAALGIASYLALRHPSRRFTETRQFTD